MLIKWNRHSVRFGPYTCRQFNKVSLIIRRAAEFRRTLKLLFRCRTRSALSGDKFLRLSELTRVGGKTFPSSSGILIFFRLPTRLLLKWRNVSKIHNAVFSRSNRSRRIFVIFIRDCKLQQCRLFYKIKYPYENYVFDDTFV